jgi:hypothetical protein
LFSAVLLASIGNAWADKIPITYNIVDYPLSQADIIPDNPTSPREFIPSGLGTWSVTGTITTDGTLGYLLPVNITNISFTLSGPAGTASYSGTQPIELGYGVLTATTTGLYLPPNIYQSPPLALGDDPLLEYQNNPGYPFYAGGIPNASTPFLNMDGWYDNAAPGDYAPNFGAGPGSITYNSPDWVIATAAPEPSTLVLLGLGTIALVGVAWRRRHV